MLYYQAVSEGKSRLSSRNTNLKQQGIALEGQNELGRTRIELEDMKGNYLNKNFKHGNIEGKSSLSSRDTNLKEQGITPDESARARIITEEVDLREEVMDEIEAKNDVITPHKVASGIKKKRKEEEIKKQKDKIIAGEISLPKGLFDIIVIDPPWKYGREYDPDSSRVASPYPEMSFDELSRMTLSSDNDCILWLWTTHQFIWEAKELMKIWEFDYKRIMLWDKEKMGIGYWLRMQCEFCLLGIKGKPLWDIKDLRDIIRYPRGNHSAKPDSFYEMINTKFVSKSKYKADYFGRKEREGWKIKKD